MFPKTLGYGRDKSGTAFRLDTMAHGITIDTALRDTRYRQVVLDFLPVVAYDTARMHMAQGGFIKTKDSHAENYVRRILERKYLFQHSNCSAFLSQTIRESIVNASSAIGVIETALFVWNLDSHPEQFTVVIEEREGRNAITQYTRFDFEPERKHPVPFTNELANLFRYGDYDDGHSFQRDYFGVEAYIEGALSSLSWRKKPKEFRNDPLGNNYMLAYLNSVIFRGLCFYDAWFQENKREHMLPRVPEILANINAAVQEIFIKHTPYFIKYRKQYTALRRVLPDMRKCAEDALAK